MSGAQRQGTTNRKGLLREADKISIIDRGGAMSTLEVVAMRIMALEVAKQKARPKSLVMLVVWVLVHTWPSQRLSMLSMDLAFV